MLRSVRPSGIVVFPYLAFMNPFWICTTIMLWLLLRGVGFDLVGLIEASVRAGKIWFPVALLAYAWWTVGIARRTRARSVIVGSRSIYVRDLRRRFRYGEVQLHAASRFPAETLEVSSRMFPLSVFVRAFWFHSLGFLSLGLPLTATIRKKRGTLPGRSHNVR
jgi:hypothetical protein